jgi:hypothetical protein
MDACQQHRGSSVTKPQEGCESGAGALCLCEFEVLVQRHIVVGSDKREDHDIALGTLRPVDGANHDALAHPCRLKRAAHAAHLGRVEGQHAQRACAADVDPAPSQRADRGQHCGGLVAVTDAATIVTLLTVARDVKKGPGPSEPCAVAARVANEDARPARAHAGVLEAAAVEAARREG